jgi:dipeptide/tripeptide permease
MVINIGSITGRGVSYFVRTRFGIPSIFTYAATIFALTGLLIVLFLFREPEYVSDGKKDDQKLQKRTLAQALLGIFIVLANLRFVLFLIVIGLFWFLYVQLYNLMPLFLRYIDPNAPVELYTLANPVMIVSLQLLITRMVKKWTPLKSILLGVAVTTAGMLINVLPAALLPDLAHKLNLAGLAVPAAGLVLVVSIASMAVGEMMASPRIYEYLGAIAPKGQEGLYLGYAQLPVALGSILGGLLGGNLFEKFISDPVKAGLGPRPVPMWLFVAGMGVLSMLGLAVYDRLLGKTRRPA